MKVLLIDDHPLILSALQSVIEGLDDEVVVIGAESAAAARAALNAQPDFDLVLLDLQLGDADGFDMLDEFRITYPALPVVVISASDRSCDVIRSIDLGAMGFISRRTSMDTLLQALRLVMSGGTYVPPMSMGEDVSAGVGTAAGHLDQLRLIQQQATGSNLPVTKTLQELALTPRQTDVLALLLHGKPNKIIARELGVSVDTIKDHVAAVLKILGVSSRTQAVLAVGQMVQKQTQDALTAVWRQG